MCRSRSRRGRQAEPVYGLSCQGANREHAGFSWSGCDGWNESSSDSPRGDTARFCPCGCRRPGRQHQTRIGGLPTRLLPQHADCRAARSGAPETPPFPRRPVQATGWTWTNGAPPLGRWPAVFPVRFQLGGRATGKKSRLALVLVGKAPDTGLPSNPSERGRELGRTGTSTVRRRYSSTSAIGTSRWSIRARSNSMFLRTWASGKCSAIFSSARFLA
jgi:hypothetical protein